MSEPSSDFPLLEAIEKASHRLDRQLMPLFTLSDASKEEVAAAKREIAGAFQSLHVAFAGAIEHLERRIRRLETVH